MKRPGQLILRKGSLTIFNVLIFVGLVSTIQSFTVTEQRPSPSRFPLYSASSAPTVSSVDEASRILFEWDRMTNPDSAGETNQNNEEESGRRETLAPSIRLLSEVAAEQRNRDSTQGRCMLGICAPTAQDGVAALKAWVTALDLPRGLLHGMDKDGVPIDLSGSVYIKYNSGGVYTFADIRKSGLGFDALWKPGDALLEPYDGTYRGVYFQVELEDGEFRQYLVPLDTF